MLGVLVPVPDPAPLHRATALPEVPRGAPLPVAPDHAPRLSGLRARVRARARLLRGRHVRELRPGDPDLSRGVGNPGPAASGVVRPGDPGSGAAVVRSARADPVPLFEGHLDASRSGNRPERLIASEVIETDPITMASLKKA